MIVRLWGGTGNQLFCYAFGVSVAAKRKEPVLFHKHDIGKGCTRAYGLDAFRGPQEAKFVAGVCSEEWREKQFCFDPDVYTDPEVAYFVGHWQTEKYLDVPLVREHFQLAKPPSTETVKAALLIDNSRPTCAVHVRRGDYLHPEVQRVHGSMSPEWYRQAMHYVSSRVFGVRFFVFSDDPAWCFEHWKKAAEVTIIGHNRPGSGATGPGAEHEDLFLMSRCTHAIIPNSTFGWWGAWFGDFEQFGELRERIVIGPAKWFANSPHDTRDILPDRWVRL